MRATHWPNEWFDSSTFNLFPSVSIWKQVNKVTLADVGCLTAVGKVCGESVRFRRHQVCTWVKKLNYFNASARGHQLDLSYQTSLSMFVYIWECLYAFKVGNSYLVYIWQRRASGTEERLNKRTNPHIYTLTYIRRGLGQWCNMEHRCRQRPAHSDLCNFFNRAGRKLSFLSLLYTQLTPK